MAKFLFRLQGYLNLKEKLEDQKKLDYGRAIARLEAERQKKIEMERVREQSILLFKESIREQIRPLALQGYNNYIELMKKKIKDQEAIILNAEKNVEIKRLALVEAVKERKMLETLKENARIEFIRAEQLQEQKVLDEVVSYRYNSQ